METTASVDQTRVLIGRAQALGDTLDDPLLLLSVLYGSWNASYIAFNGDALRERSAQILTLAEEQGTIVPLMVGHRLMAMSLLHTGDIAAARAHFDRAIALYDRVEHRPLATRFGQDVRVAILSFRSQAVWVLGYPEAAMADADQAVSYAREIRQAGTLMYALGVTSLTHVNCRNYATASALEDELTALVDETGALHWKGSGMAVRGWLLALSGKASDAVHMIIAGVTSYGSTGATVGLSLMLSYLASAYAELGRFHDARRCLGRAMTTMETTEERLYEAEIYRMAGEIAVKSPERDQAKAQDYFDHALAVARQQQAKSWELRAAMSMARLWRDQGKCSEARDLLAPVYGWFTEGFDTLDLKEATTLLDELRA